MVICKTTTNKHQASSMDNQTKRTIIRFFGEDNLNKWKHTLLNAFQFDAPYEGSINVELKTAILMVRIDDQQVYVCSDEDDYYRFNEIDEDSPLIAVNENDRRVIKAIYRYIQN